MFNAKHRSERDLQPSLYQEGPSFGRIGWVGEGDIIGEWGQRRDEAPCESRLVRGRKDLHKRLALTLPGGSGGSR